MQKNENFEQKPLISIEELGNGELSRAQLVKESVVAKKITKGKWALPHFEVGIALMMGIILCLVSL